MILPPKLLSIGFAFLGVIVAGNAQTLLTFDSLPPGAFPDPGYTTIPNGYGGLDWNNFGVVNGLAGENGYYTGVVSPSNVAFNQYGSPASIAAPSGLFDLESAYLTESSSAYPTLDIQVQGFVGSTMVYNNTYEVNFSGPTLINFDYIGVESVVFTSSDTVPFAMDNLTITVPEPSTYALMSITTVLGGFGVWRRKNQGRLITNKILLI